MIRVPGYSCTRYTYNTATRAREREREREGEREKERESTTGKGLSNNQREKTETEGERERERLSRLTQLQGIDRRKKNKKESRFTTSETDPVSDIRLKISTCKKRNSYLKYCLAARILNNMKSEY